MTRQAIIERAIKAINGLRTDKAEEISDFADFVRHRYEELQLSQGIQQLATESEAFNFLHDEEELRPVAEWIKDHDGTRLQPAAHAILPG